MIERTDSITKPTLGSGTQNNRLREIGNLKTRTDAKSQVFNYSYDAANRLTTLDAPGNNDDLTYRYDTCPNGQGRLCQIATAGNNVFYRLHRLRRDCGE